MTIYSLLVGALVGGVCAVIMDKDDITKAQKFFSGAVFGFLVASVPYGIWLAVREVMP
jgi:uncharacterized protein YqgC (DUF456 family)